MRRTLTAITGVLGPLLIVFGVLVFLFVAYQLWGTDLSEAHSQTQLRARFETELHQHDRATHKSGTSTTTTTAPTGPTPSTTTPAPTVAPVTAPPADGSPVGEIQIPAIGLDKVVVQGTGTTDLQQGPGHFPGTPLPGEAGNVAIAGHRTTYGAPFFNLNELTSKDTITITTVQGTFIYQVMDTIVVAPSDTAVVAPTAGATLTLTTCNPRFSASSRLVVQAVLTTPPIPTPVVVTPPSHSHKATATAAQTSDLAGEQGAWEPALWWGLAVVLIALMGWRGSRRVSRRSARWSAYALSGVAGLVVLFFFFGAISPLLPASF